MTNARALPLAIRNGHNHSEARACCVVRTTACNQLPSTLAPLPTHFELSEIDTRFLMPDLGGRCLNQLRTKLHAFTRTACTQHVHLPP